MFVQLRKLSFLLVVIATIAMGVPIGNMITTPIFKRDEINSMHIDTLPQCLNPNYQYKASLCENAGRIRVFCQDPNNPTLEIINFTDCKDDEYCIEHYHNVSEDLETPHATCVPHEHVTIWDNFGNPRGSGDSCGVVRYSKYPADIEVGMTVYATDKTPIQVNILDAYSNGNLLSYNNNKHNYTYFIKSYNYETIKYCFNTGGTGAMVKAYAASWLIL